MLGVILPVSQRYINSIEKSVRCLKRFCSLCMSMSHALVLRPQLSIQAIAILYTADMNKVSTLICPESLLKGLTYEDLAACRICVIFLTPGLSSCSLMPDRSAHLHNISKTSIRNRGQPNMDINDKCTICACIL